MNNPTIKKGHKLFWFELVPDEKSKLAISTTIFQAPNIDAAWRLAYDRIQELKPYCNKIENIYMLADGEKGVSIKLLDDKVELYFDENLERSMPYSAGYFPCKEYN
jgi:hypothetical protein